MQRLMTGLLRVLEALLAILLLAISLLVVTQVVLRYAFNSSITGANETITILFIYMTAIGAAVAVGKQEHIAITAGLETLPYGLQGLANRAKILAVAMINGALICFSWNWIRVTGRYLMPTTELPRAAVQLAVPIGCGFAVLFCLALLLTDNPFKPSPELVDELTREGNNES